ncbi:MAG: DUF6036 family nucleotidyltransferase [Gemmatimonadaceae bacterium]
MRTRSDFEEAFRRLGQYLEAVGAAELRLVIVGGAALNLLGLVSRTTTDADVIAVEEGGALVAPNDLPPALLEGVAIVAASLRLPEDWLNTGPSLQMRYGLPPGFRERLTWLDFKPLRVGLASRKDLVTLKLFATADHWPARGVHYSDLVALSPVSDEILSAAEWAKTQDAGPEFPRLIDAVVASVMEDVHH